MLTPEQKRAIAFRDGNLQVIACAGAFFRDGDRVRVAP